MSGFLCTMVGASFTVAAAAEVIRLKKGITAVGNAQIDTAQSKFGGSSALFDGTDDALQITDVSWINWNSDFTVELWIRMSQYGEQVFFDTREGTGGNGTGGYLVRDSSSVLRFYLNGTSIVSKSDPNITTNTWYHVAITRSGNNFNMWIDGTSVSSATSSTTGTAYKFYIGRNSYSASSGNTVGHIDEFRFSNTARYTTNFTPSTTPFVNDDNTLLLIHANGTDASTFFEDDNGVRMQAGLESSSTVVTSTTQSKFGLSSVYFPETSGQYLNAYYNTQTMGLTNGGDFTIEAWCYFTKAPNLGDTGYMMLYSHSPEPYLLFQANSLSLGAGGYPTFTRAGSANWATNTWYHIAVSRSSGNLRVFENGTQIGSTVTGSTYNFIPYTDNLSTRFGKFGDDRGRWQGYIDEIRFSKVARYTSNFTAPTEAFVNDADTLLLIHGDGTNNARVFRDDNGLIPTTYTSDVVAFDGTGDYYDATSLSSSVTADSKYALIALNLYWAGGNNLQHPFNIRLGTGSGDYGFWVWINGGRSQLKFVTGTGSVPGSIYENTENSLTANAWNQIVIWVDTTSSTTSQIWVNGNSKAYSNDGFPTGALFNWTNTASTVKIGQKNTSQTGDGNDFNGRISQVYLSAASSFPGIEYFWDKSTNRPKDFGTDGRATGLAQPLIYHYGGTSTFPTNRGNFASYTLTANGGVTTNAANTIYARARRQRGIQALANAQIDTAQSKFGGAAALFDGTGDYLEVANNFNWHNQSAGTIEFFFRLNSTVPFAQGLFSQCIQGAATGLQLLTVNNRLNLYKSATTAYEAYNVNIVTGQFYHIAIVKESSTTVKFYVDGTLRHTDSSANGFTDSTANFFIGRGFGLSSSLWDGTRYDLNGWIDEFRISNTARYTANFTPTTTPFQNDANTLLLLHMDGTDASTVFFDDNGRDTTPT